MLDVNSGAVRFPERGGGVRDAPNEYIISSRGLKELRYFNVCLSKDSASTTLQSSDYSPSLDIIDQFYNHANP